MAQTPVRKSGLVIGGYRRHCAVELPDGTTIRCAMKGRSLTPACGDEVDIETGDDRDGVIVTVHPRRSELTREDAYKQKTIAANVSVVLGVVAVEPPFNPELIDRWTVAAEGAGCRFVLILNKMDLAGAEAVEARLAPYAALGYAVIPLRARQGIDPLRPLLSNERSVLVGQSGMGKSTIINAALGSVRAKTGAISISLNTGKHTTTHTQLHRLGPTAWIIDSPGMQEFGVHQLGRGGLEQAFVEFRPHLGKCKFRDCTHDHEPHCAIRAACEAGTIAASRLATFQRLRREIEG